MRKIHLLLGLVPLLLGGCEVGQLQDNTTSVSASTTDIYYQMVLQNLARDYTQKHALPWGIALTSGTVAVNDNLQLMAGYTETSQAITPSATGQYQRILQQQWATAPVSDYDALSALHQYYDDVVAAHDGTGLPYLCVQYIGNQNAAQTSAVEGDGKTVKPGFLAIGQRPGTGADGKPTMVNIYYRVGTTASRNDLLSGAMHSDQNFSINLKVFQFLHMVPPRDTISGTFDHTNAYVAKDQVHDLALFTLVILGTIDQIPSPSTSGSSSAGAAPAFSSGH